MRAIMLGRAQGKTERMLSWLISRKSHVLVVMSSRERDRLRDLFRKEDAKKDETDRIVCISEVLTGGTRGKWGTPIYGIDNLEHVLPTIFRGPVEVVTFTPEEW